MSTSGVRQAAKNRHDFLPPASRGLTFIELIVVMALLAILATITVSSMGALAARQQFESEANEVARSITEQRTKSIAALADQQYGVRVTANEIAYFASTTPSFNPASTASTSLNHSVATFSLSGGVDYLSFARITGVPSATGTIQLYSATADATSTITIYASGSIVQD